MKSKSHVQLKDWSVSDLPREKMKTKGVSSLSDAELLAILLRSGSVQENAVDIARRILADCNDNLVELSRRQLMDLKAYDGVGDTKAMSILAALELGKRRRTSDVLQRKQVRSSADVYEYIQDCLTDLDHEEFWIVVLSNGNQIMERLRVSVGGVAATIVDPKLVFKQLLQRNAAAFILCHNHPSDNIRPSEQDRHLTQALKKASELFCIRMLDHLIVGSQQYFSFLDEGQL